MTTKREQVLGRLFQVLDGVAAKSRWREAIRNEVMPVEIPESGLIILRDGAPGEPEVTLSPLTYSWQHRAEIEIYAQSGRRDEDEIFDALVEAIGLALAEDRTLGGLCDWVEPMPPDPQVLPVQGGAPIKAATIPVILYYDTSDPLS
jgi:hypothetical protein